ITFVHVTHSQEEALALADLVVVMDGGRIQQAGSPRTVYDTAKTPFVASFIGDHNVVHGQAVEQAAQEVTLTGEGGSRFIIPGQAHIGEKVTFSVRADHAFLLPSVDQTLPLAENQLAGVASVVEYAGYQVRVKLETPQGLEFTLYVPEKQFSNAPISLNQPIRVGWHREDAMQLRLA
ncbi:MAG: TOBE domain-containing protein, partial [Caldilineaceae bacterium]|nr:TOBE domain-containing protein [Caldilineaceae bacterium]